MASAGSAEQFVKCINEELKRDHAQIILRKFARSKFINIPFNFTKQAEILDGNIKICHQWIFYKWQIEEKIHISDKIDVPYTTRNVNFNDRFSHVPDKFQESTLDYVVPNSEFETQCPECIDGIKFCPECKGTKRVVCSVCLGTGIEEQQYPCTCDNGILRTSVTKRYRMPADKTGWTEEIEEESTCYLCSGKGFNIREVRCTECFGRGTIPCLKCKGTGLIPCSKCQGLGKIERIKVTTVKLIPIGNPHVRIYKDNIPDAYFKEYINGTYGEEVFSHIKFLRDNVVEKAKIYKVKTIYLKYKFKNVTYSLYQISNKFKYENYPRRFKWF